MKPKILNNRFVFKTEVDIIDLRSGQPTLFATTHCESNANPVNLLSSIGKHISDIAEQELELEIRWDGDMESFTEDNHQKYFLTNSAGDKLFEIRFEYEMEY